MTQPLDLQSRANPLLVQLRRLARDGAGYRRDGRVWVEGEHLCAATRAAGMAPDPAIISSSGWARDEVRRWVDGLPRVVRVPDALFADLSPLGSPASVGYVLQLPVPAAVDPLADAVVLDRVQDAGNVGSILRSAAALGVRQVLAISGTAALWSPKVLRAGMGAHFALSLHEGLGEDALLALRLPLVITSSHNASPLPTAPLPAPAAWLFGHEGQGVSDRLAAASVVRVGIPQPGGEESLNVAAAAAICLYESMRRRQ